MNCKKISKALCAASVLNEIVLEKYLADILPETKQLYIKQLNKDTGYKYNKIRKFTGNNYYKVTKKTVNIIADNQLLSKKSKSACKHLILKLVYPSQLNESSFETRAEQYIIDTDYTAEEIEFINLMFNELLSITSIKGVARQISATDLFDFNSLNGNSFYHTAKKIYNDILQKKLYAGDNVTKYFKTDLSDKEIAERLEKSCKFDYFFNKDGILKCDLNTNTNILIKNFLNTVLYSFIDPDSRTALLQKLNSKYPVLI